MQDKLKKFSEAFNEKVELDKQINALIEEFKAKNPTVHFYEGHPVKYPFKCRVDFDMATYNFSTE